GGSTTAVVSLSNAATARLDAWVDFDGNGTFDPAEHVFNAVPIVAGANSLSFPVPASSVFFTFARFRVTPNGIASPIGNGGLGEVEDYAVHGEVQVFDWGDAPDSYFTTNGAGGPYHALGGPQLGNLIDFDGNGQPTFGAIGDDLNGTTPDDEDGVTLPSMTPGGTATASVTLANAATGMLDAWVDFNGNGVFDHPAEQIFSSTPLTPGVNSLSFPVPISAVPGGTHARFRVSTTGGLTPVGYGGPGEVEDYRAAITPGPTGFTGTADQFGDLARLYIKFMQVDGETSRVNFAGRTGKPVLDEFSDPSQGGVTFQPDTDNWLYGAEGDPGTIENLDGFDGSYAENGHTILVHLGNHQAPYFEIVLTTPALAIGSFVGTGKEGTETTLRIRAYAEDGTELYTYDTHVQAFDDPDNREGFWGVKMESPEIARVTIQNLNETDYGNSLLLDGLTIVRPYDDTCDLNGDGLLSVADLDAFEAAMQSGAADDRFDLNGNGVVDVDDLRVFAYNCFNTDLGDANLDGEFNSSDIVTAFQGGAYELDVPASWSQGDWNGDGRFNTADFVTAFQTGWYEQGPLASVAAATEDAQHADESDAADLTASAVDQLFGLLGQRSHRKPAAVI
ncbi:MAG: hypothetical protein KDA92_11095, partial [Planctomycetales bacterium]|nr:hypothetical protein [Planctomycetales bacterium]